MLGQNLKSSMREVSGGEASLLASPSDGPLSINDLDTDEVPTGPLHMEVPIEACGRTMKLDLEVQPSDLSVRMLANRRKSFVVQMTDGIKGQIQEALKAESLKTPNGIAVDSFLGSATTSPRSSDSPRSQSPATAVST